MKFDDRLLKPEANNLTLVRLVLASSVIYTHCYWLLSGRSGEDELSWLLGAPISAYAVDGFFFLSGFLVYASLHRRPRVGDFLLARIVRLWPALAFSVLLTVLAGYAFTNSPDTYFSGATLRFLRNNLSLVAPAYNLTGVMCDGRPCVINGSLWTMPWEARCYVLLGLLALLGLAREKWMVRIVLPVSFGLALLWHVPGVQEAAAAQVGRDALYYPEMADRLWTLFALGVAAYIFRERIPLSWTALAILFLFNLAARRWGFDLHGQALLVGYALLCFGFLSARACAVSGRWHDYSYGMYIFAFPVMMALGQWREWESHFLLAGATVLATLPLAILCWHMVEQPALDWFRRRRGTAAAPPAAVSAAP